MAHINSESGTPGCAVAQGIQWRWDIVGESSPSTNKGNRHEYHLESGALISLIAGVLILVVPRLLNYIVAAYLIVVGLLGLFGGVHLR